MEGQKNKKQKLLEIHKSPGRKTSKSDGGSADSGTVKEMTLVLEEAGKPLATNRKHGGLTTKTSRSKKRRSPTIRKIGHHNMTKKLAESSTERHGGQTQRMTRR